MTIEVKQTPQYTKAIEGRTVTGIFCVHGNIDDGGDRSWPGLFAETNRAQFLWMHKGDDPPIALIKSIRDIGRSDLPPAVLAKAPDATGGVEVVREYFDDPFSDRIFKAVQVGAIREMSYAYEVTDARPEQASGQLIRNLYKADLYDISDVNWGMNEATSAMKASWKARPVIDHIDAVEASFDELIERLSELKDRRGKEGRVLADRIRSRLGNHGPKLREVADDIEALLKETEPKQTGRTELNQLRAAYETMRQRHRELGVPLL